MVEPAIRKYADPITEARDLCKLMRADEDRVSGLPDALEELRHVVLAARIEP
jgi:hypothetical protein